MSQQTDLLEADKIWRLSSINANRRSTKPTHPLRIRNMLNHESTISIL